MDEKTRNAISKRVEREGFAEKLGLNLVSFREGHAVVEMVPDSEDTNIFGMVHGGVIFSLMDEAFQISCNSHGTIAVALSVNVIYHNPSRVGRKLIAESKEVHRSKKTATYEIQVKDEDQNLIASCHALSYRKKDKLPFLE